MCFNLTQAEAEQWRARGRKLVSDAVARSVTHEIDPLLRSAPKLSQLVSSMQSIRISHGFLIEEALVDAINQVPGWQAERGIRVTHQGKPFMPDCFAHHAASRTLYVFESKRGHSGPDSDKQSAIDNRLGQVTPAAQTRAQALGLPVLKTDTIIVSFYGAKWKSVYRIVDAAEAATLFPPCAVAFVAELSRYLENRVAEHFDLPKNNPSVFESTDDGDVHFDANGGGVPLTTHC